MSQTSPVESDATQTKQMLLGEQMKDRMFVPVFTFWQPPFCSVNEYIRPVAPAGQPASWNIVTQWLPEPPSTYTLSMNVPRRIWGVRWERLTRNEWRPPN